MKKDSLIGLFGVVCFFAGMAAIFFFVLGDDDRQEIIGK